MQGHYHTDYSWMNENGPKVGSGLSLKGGGVGRRRSSTASRRFAVHCQGPSSPCFLAALIMARGGLQQQTLTTCNHLVVLIARFSEEQQRKKWAVYVYQSLEYRIINFGVYEVAIVETRQKRPKLMC